MNHVSVNKYLIKVNIGIKNYMEEFIVMNGCFTTFVAAWMLTLCRVKLCTEEIAEQICFLLLMQC